MVDTGLVGPVVSQDQDCPRFPWAWESVFQLKYLEKTYSHFHSLLHPFSAPCKRDYDSLCTCLCPFLSFLPTPYFLFISKLRVSLLFLLVTIFDEIRRIAEFKTTFFFHMTTPSVRTILFTSRYDSPSSCLGGPLSYLGNTQKSWTTAQSSLHSLTHEQP